MAKTTPKTRPKARPLPTLALETVLIQRVGGLVCGVDEAGRGPWAVSYTHLTLPTKA